MRALRPRNLSSGGWCHEVDKLHVRQFDDHNVVPFLFELFSRYEMSGRTPHLEAKASDSGAALLSIAPLLALLVYCLSHLDLARTAHSFTSSHETSRHGRIRHKRQVMSTQP